jgi:ATP-dependent helicase/nuclease subunit A
VSPHDRRGPPPAEAARGRPPAPDQEERDAAIRARDVNVLVDAGAGTGKTTLIVDRILELVAPRHGGRPVPLERIAAITFTRRAAGELKLRIREALLRARAREGLDGSRRDLLQGALLALDTAWVGTIHGFADRLLRLWPVEAGLSPSYEVVEDAAALHAETHDLVLQAVELGTLADVVERPELADLAREAEGAIVDALEVGLRAESAEHAHGEWVGLDRLFQRFVETRDAPPRVERPPPPDLGRFRALVGELTRLAQGVAGEGEGSRHVRRLAGRLGRLASEGDPVRILAELVRLEQAKPRDMSRKRAFPGDGPGWDAWKAWDGDGRKGAVRPGCLRDETAGPFRAWLARRLVRCAPVVAAAHDRVKRRRGAVDQVDLLLQLRDLLQRNRDVRADLQARFDQILVDEFQDTDPLQAEIVLYLCEAGAAASTWREVALAPGKLTVVGDPKQSIYRFRRADIEVYAEVRAIVQRGPHLEASLRANFRCAPGLIAWLDDRFDGLLGRAGPGAPPFDPDLGTVANVPLLPGRPGAPDARVVTLPIGAAGGRVESFRAAEARALATFLRDMVDAGERQVVDPITDLLRPVGFGDVAVLTAATTQLRVLLPELDRLGIPHAVRGSRIFLEDPLHRQFILALRCLADPQDGVARAALYRAPFFSVDLDDLAREKAAPDSADPGVARARAAHTLVEDLRFRRLERPPGDTARDLLEHTALARAVALGPNGAQRLDGLNELCLRLDALACEEGLDYDGATQRMRSWAVSPVELDPPRPVGAKAVQILSIHQSKGLEFPVVALWDCCAKLSAREESSPFAVDRDGARWALALDRLVWSEPDGGDFATREQAYRDAERLRVVYVAATRARDLLVLPVARSTRAAGYITGRLAEGAPSRLVEPLPAYALEDEPLWARHVAPPARPVPGDASALAAAVEARWTAARTEAGRPLLSPVSVTSLAHREAAGAAGEEIEAAAPAPEPEEDAGKPAQPRPGRFGPVFGDTVHRAIGLALAAGLAPDAAVVRAAAGTGLSLHLDEAAADVTRALAALAGWGLARPPGPDLRLEYPVAQASPDGSTLLAGYVDLLGVRRAPGDGRLAVVDFKTDAPPPPGADLRSTHGAYARQVTAYAQLVSALCPPLRGSTAPGGVAAGLLFTADGGLRWLE